MLDAGLFSWLVVNRVFNHDGQQLPKVLQGALLHLMKSSHNKSSLLRMKRRNSLSSLWRDAAVSMEVAGRLWNVIFCECQDLSAYHPVNLQKSRDHPTETEEDVRCKAVVSCTSVAASWACRVSATSGK